MRNFFRKLHRWLGLLMALQIVAWMASGLYFSLIPISEIRGEHLTRSPAKLETSALAHLSSPGNVAELLNEQLGKDWTLDRLEPVSRDGQILWQVEGESGGEGFARLVAADGRQVMPMLTEREALRHAQALLVKPGEGVSVSWVEQASAGSEIRGRKLPVWRVDFLEPESLSLYIHPWTGDLLARRTDRWRIFDFLWMLHIMDFDTRDDFSHPLLQIAAALGLIIALSGVVFWAMTTRLFRRRRIVPGLVVK
jgi:uncharacterized iron-regulated membrane protein